MCKSLSQLHQLPLPKLFCPSLAFENMIDWQDRKIVRWVVKGGISLAFPHSSIALQQGLAPRLPLRNSRIKYSSRFHDRSCLLPSYKYQNLSSIFYTHAFLTICSFKEDTIHTPLVLLQKWLLLRLLRKFTSRCLAASKFMSKQKPAETGQYRIPTTTSERI